MIIGMKIHPIYERNEPKAYTVGEKVTDKGQIAREEARFKLERSMEKAREEAAERTDKAIPDMDDEWADE